MTITTIGIDLAKNVFAVHDGTQQPYDYLTCNSLMIKV